MDLYGCDKQKLGSEDAILKLLKKIPATLNLTPISEPKVFKYDHPKNPDRWGYTGNIAIAESHIYIHTFAELGTAMVDISSCEPFDTSIAENLAKEKLGAQKIVSKNIERLTEQ
ncbi:S-adenosylmethionine decarboxylase [Candidatus Undinarchaeota archaeon]